MNWILQILSSVKSLLGSVLGFSRTPRQRNIFVYWDGEKICKADPLNILYRMQMIQDEFNLARDGVALDQGDIETTKRVTDAMYQVFNVKPLGSDEHGNEFGMTSSEVMELLRNFIGFQEQLKKNSKDSQTSPQSMVAA